MVRSVVGLIAGALMVGAMVAPVSAEGWHNGALSLRFGDRDGRIKDCARINGRYGYYGNPWCTPREQARWDKWSARKHRR